MYIQNAISGFITDDLLMGQPTEPVEPDTNLLTTGLVDSLGIMRVILFIEETFGVAVPPEDILIEYFLTVQTMSTYLMEKHNVANAESILAD